LIFPRLRRLPVSAQLVRANAFASQLSQCK
jgi:hypothetical protein